MLKKWNKPSSKNTPEMKKVRAGHLGIEFVSPVIVGIFIGCWIDNYLQSAPFGVITLVILGFATGFWNIFKFINKMKKKDEKSD